MCPRKLIFHEIIKYNLYVEKFLHKKTKQLHAGLGFSQQTFPIFILHISEDGRFTPSHFLLLLMLSYFTYCTVCCTEWSLFPGLCQIISFIFQVVHKIKSA